MAIYGYRIYMASQDKDSDNKAWLLMRQIERLAARSGMQVNSINLEKDNKEYPKSPEQMERQKAWEKSKARERAMEELRKAEDQLARAEAELASLG